MKSGNLLKNKLLTDILFQMVLFLLSGAVFITNPDQAAFLFYFVLGGYQLLSSLVHLAIQRPGIWFSIYYIQLLLYIPLFVILFSGSIAIGYFLLCVTPLSALYYFIITIIAFNHAKK